MMKFFFYMVFMIPLDFGSYFVLSQFMYMYLYMNLMLKNIYSYFSSISYFLGMDFFSYNLILLAFLILSFMIISMLGYPNFFFFNFLNLLLMVFLYIIFTSLNFMYMYMSFEFILVPLVILVMGWGYQPERLIAGLYMFFYTVLVSLPLMILLLIIYIGNGCLFLDFLTFDSDFCLTHFILMIVFLVKLPMCFVHFWLPKAHVQAPVSGSMILAGLMLKIGGYGLIRIMYMYEYMYINYSYVWFTLSIVGSFMVSIICLIQSDMKCLIAYSSISHMGMVIMGLVTMSSWGLIGSYLLMLGHGFCSSALFYMSNIFYKRTGSRSFFVNKGLMLYMPSCSMYMFMFCAFNMSCPPSVNFISELMILSSMMNYWLGSTMLFIGLSFFCACFSYYLYSYNQHGLYHNLYSFSTLNLLELLCLFMHLIPLVLISIMVSSFI